jgi:putative membrane protein
MQVKLSFVVLLIIYQLYGQRLLVRLHKDSSAVSSTRMRFMNEVSTVLLIAIVFIIVKRDALDWLYGVFGILWVAVTLSIAIKWYKRFRNKKGE